MKSLKNFLMCLVFITILLSVNAETATTDANVTKKVSKLPTEKITDDNIGTTHKIGRNNPVENKKVIGQKPFKSCVDPKASISNSKLTKIPINVVFANKPRTVPMKIPIILKTGNAKTAPTHYVRLKEIPERKKDFKQKSYKEIEKEKRKFTPVDIGTHPHSKSTHKHMFRNSKFYEDDSNDVPVQSVSKTSNNIRQHEKLPDKSDFPTNSQTKKVADNKSEQRSQELATDDSYNETLHIENGTHSINIMKLPQSVPSNVPIKGANEGKFDEHLEVFLSDDTSLNQTSKELEVSSSPIDEQNISKTFATSDEKQQILNESDNLTPIFREYPIDTANTGFDAPAIVTIKDRNYEEFEEKTAPPVYSESTDENEFINNPWSEQPIKPGSLNPYNPYFQNYQAVYNQYLKCFDTNKPDIYNKQLYHDANLPEGFSTSEFAEMQSSPETQIVQDIYGQNPDTQKNIIDVRPENSVGRIWRTWKDTEIKFTDPRYLQLLQKGRTMNGINYNTEAFAKTPRLYGSQAVGFNRYFNNLNNAYPYSYPSTYI